MKITIYSRSTTSPQNSQWALEISVLPLQLLERANGPDVAYRLLLTRVHDFVDLGSAPAWWQQPCFGTKVWPPRKSATRYPLGGKLRDIPWVAIPSATRNPLGIAVPMLM
jgi:hypothetical protein